MSRALYAGVAGCAPGRDFYGFLMRALRQSSRMGYAWAAGATIAATLVGLASMRTSTS